MAQYFVYAAQIYVRQIHQGLQAGDVIKFSFLECTKAESTRMWQIREAAIVNYHDTQLHL